MAQFIHLTWVAAAVTGALLFCTSSAAAVAAVGIREDIAEDITEEAGFNSFIKKYNRSYKQGTEEYAMRQALFTQRFSAVTAHNSKPAKLWKARIGRFSDFTEEERRAMRGYRRLGHRERASSALARKPAQPLPERVDWTHLKTARHIRDQSDCGSCWAITTVSVLEAHYEIHHGTPKSFSAQQLLDCTPNPQECGGQGGCKGATVELGMAWILKNGISSEEDEPYIGQDKVCSLSKKAADSKLDSEVMLSTTMGLTGYATLAQNVEQPLAEAVAQYGPVGVSAAAGEWFEYDHGIFDSCGKDGIVDHAITLYGYGTDKHSNQKYWLLRNSWGADWGENGFLRLLRHEKGEKYCGIDSAPEEGTGCKGGPKQVTICGMCGILWDSVVPYWEHVPERTNTDSTLSKKQPQDHPIQRHSTAINKDGVLVRRESQAHQ